SALAQSNSGGAQANGNVNLTPSGASAVAGTDANAKTKNASVEAGAGANADAEVQKWIETVKEKGEKVSSSARNKADSKLDAAAKKVNEEASVNGDGEVATRIATEFGMSPDAVTDEKNRLDVSWGELTIAHTLSANAKSKPSVDALFEMRKDHMG